MKKIIINSISLLLCCHFAMAQNELDALRYSQTQLYGNARSAGYGNANGAIGADFGGLSANPAGIGLYRKSEFIFSPNLKINSAKATYQNNSSGTTTTKFNVNTLGLVFISKADENYHQSPWVSTGFAIGYNRVNDFNVNYTYSGANNTNSGSSYFSNGANDTNTNDKYSPQYLGYQTYLINKNSAGQFQSVVTPGMPLTQTKTYTQSGNMNEIVLSFGGNYNNVLMLGVTIGIPSIHYNTTKIFTEKDASGNTNNDFDNFTYTEKLNTTATGINLKLGGIVKLSDLVRLGFAYHTGSSFAMNDLYAVTLQTNTENLKIKYNDPTGPISFAQPAKDNNFSYTLITPNKFIASAAYFFNKNGFVSVDIENVNYTNMRFKYSSEYVSYQTAVNNKISMAYKNNQNYRVGAEWRIENKMFRAGINLVGNPKKTSERNFSSIKYALGFGLRFDQVYLDAAYVLTKNYSQEQPYTIDGVNTPIASINNSMSSIIFSICTKF